LSQKATGISSKHPIEKIQKKKLATITGLVYDNLSIKAKYHHVPVM